VTGIEPAWPAWKARDSRHLLGWSAPSRAHAVPSACLSVTWPAGGAAPCCPKASGQSGAAVRGAIAAHAGSGGASPSCPPRPGRLTGPVRRDGGRRHGHSPAIYPGGFLHRAVSVRAVDRVGEGSADLPHARVGQPSEPLDEDRDRDALDRVHVDHAAAGYRVLAGLEADFADEGAACRREGAARCGRGRDPGRVPSRCSGSGRRWVHVGGGRLAPAHPERGSGDGGALPRAGAAWEAALEAA
jgi:hypothetical protein